MVRCRAAISRLGGAALRFVSAGPLLIASLLGGSWLLSGSSLFFAVSLLATDAVLSASLPSSAGIVLAPSFFLGPGRSPCRRFARLVSVFVAEGLYCFGLGLPFIVLSL